MADRVTPPGVFVTEQPQGTPVITGVPTAVTAFVGRTPSGPTAPQQCTSFFDFQQTFGIAENYPLSFAIRDFFNNGGDTAVVVRVTEPSPSGGDAGAPHAADLIGREDLHTGIYALDGVDLFNLLCIPPDRDDFPDVELTNVYQKAAAYCVKRRAMLIMDPPQKWSAAARAGHFDQIQSTDLGIGHAETANCAVYFPRIQELDVVAPGNLVKSFAASGAIAGVFARSDHSLGVWKAPAGVNAPLEGVVGLEIGLTDAQNGMLNPRGINCLRTFAGHGSVIWGARTLRGAAPGSAFPYIPARRLALYIEQSIYRGIQFAVFEPNNPTLWATLIRSISNFMLGLWQQGALLGAGADQSYFVKCDATTTTPADIANGVVNIQVGFAPEHPAEFVILPIQQMAGQTKP
jgi:phage tail sheath protein FI